MSFFTSLAPLFHNFLVGDEFCIRQGMEAALFCTFCTEGKKPTTASDLNESVHAQVHHGNLLCRMVVGLETPKLVGLRDIVQTDRQRIELSGGCLRGQFTVVC